MALNVIRDMEDKLFSWIVGVASSSFILIGIVGLFLPVMIDSQFYKNPVIMKLIAFVVTYVFSLWLLSYSKSKQLYLKHKLWLVSLVIHTVIILWVYYVVQDTWIFVVLIPELIILLLLIIGSISIWRRLRNVTI